jgi:hypothetical protein
MRMRQKSEALGEVLNGDQLFNLPFSSPKTCPPLKSRMRLLDKPSAKVFVSYFPTFLLFLASKPSIRNILGIQFSG